MFQPESNKHRWTQTRNQKLITQRRKTKTDLFRDVEIIKTNEKDRKCMKNNCLSKKEEEGNTFKKVILG